MTVRTPQAIRGVSLSSEAPLEDIYPSIASTGVGKALDRLYNLIPQGFGQIRLSYLLFVPPTAPLALLSYLTLKVTGERYAITNRGVKRVRVLGGQTLQQAAFEDMHEIQIDPESRSEFFQTADIRLNDIHGQTLLALRGVPRPDRVVDVIREAKRARGQVKDALDRIAARPT